MSQPTPEFTRQIAAIPFDSPRASTAQICIPLRRMPIHRLSKLRHRRVLAARHRGALFEAFMQRQSVAPGNMN